MIKYLMLFTLLLLQGCNEKQVTQKQAVNETLRVTDVCIEGVTYLHAQNANHFAGTGLSVKYNTQGRVILCEKEKEHDQ